MFVLLESHLYMEEKFAQASKEAMSSRSKARDEKNALGGNLILWTQFCTDV